MSKFTQIRYRAIDRALRRSPEGVSWQQLAQVCHDAYLQYGFTDRRPPSRRTILEDIRTLRTGWMGQPAPLEYKKGLGYYYTDRSYSLQEAPLTPEDLTTLLDLADWSSQLTYGQLPSGFVDTIHRLANHLHTRVRAQLPSLHLDRPGGLDGRENMPPLYEAILQQVVVRIDYQDYLSANSVHTLSPFVLKEYNRRWFVLAYDHEQKKLWTFPLDRIKGVTELPLTPFYNHPSLQPFRWFEPIVGVIRPADASPVTVRIRTTQLQACYLRTKPLHNSQVEESPLGAERAEFSFQLIPNPELEMQLLSFGEAVEVVAPQDLRDRIAERVRQMLASYVV
jgi:predicted DNA-binding transcriptional regulator YafY